MAVDIVPQLLENLYEIRMQRLNVLSQIIDTADPNAANYIIADCISLLENAYIMLNIPQDGFVSLAPKEPDGDNKS